MAENSLIAALLSPTAAAEMERRRQAEQGQVSSNPFAKLLTESSKTAQGLRSSLGGLFGTELRSASEIRAAGIRSAIENAEGATLQERLQNALPTIGQIDPVIGMQLEEKIRGMGDQFTYKDIRMGTRTETVPNPLGPTLPGTTKVVANIRTGVFKNGTLVGYLGDDGQMIPLTGKQAEEAQAIADAAEKSTGVVKDDIETPDTVIDLGGNARLIRQTDMDGTAKKTTAEEQPTPTATTPSTAGQMRRRNRPQTTATNTQELQGRLISLRTRLENTKNPQARKGLQAQIKRIESQLPEEAKAPVKGTVDTAQMTDTRPARQYPNVPTEPGKLGFELPPVGGQLRAIGKAVAEPDGTIRIQIGGSKLLPMTPKQLADRGLSIRGDQVVVINEGLFRQAISRASQVR